MVKSPRQFVPGPYEAFIAEVQSQKETESK